MSLSRSLPLMWRGAIGAIGKDARAVFRMADDKDGGECGEGSSRFL